MADVVVVCGTRTWNDERTISRALQELPAGTILRHGGAKGADLLAAKCGRMLGFKVEPAFKPDYERYGRWDAPKQRNTEMLKTRPIPKLVIAFWDGESSGTLDTILKACIRNIPVIIYAAKGVSIDVYAGQSKFHEWDENQVKVEVK